MLDGSPHRRDDTVAAPMGLSSFIAGLFGLFTWWIPFFGDWSRPRRVCSSAPSISNGPTSSRRPARMPTTGFAIAGIVCSALDLIPGGAWTLMMLLSALAGDSTVVVEPDPTRL